MCYNKITDSLLPVEAVIFDPSRIKCPEICSTACVFFVTFFSKARLVYAKQGILLKKTETFFLIF